MSMRQNKTPCLKVTNQGLLHLILLGNNKYVIEYICTKHFRNTGQKKNLMHIGKKCDYKKLGKKYYKSKTKNKSTQN